MRAIFFDEGDAAAVRQRLHAAGYSATVAREPFAGEDDDEDHPWAVTSDAPEVSLELLVEEYDGWLEHDDESGDGSGPVAGVVPPLDLPTSPRRHHRPDSLGFNP